MHRKLFVNKGEMLRKHFPLSLFFEYDAAKLLLPAAQHDPLTRKICRCERHAETLYLLAAGLYAALFYRAAGLAFGGAERRFDQER